MGRISLASLAELSFSQVSDGEQGFLGRGADRTRVTIQGPATGSPASSKKRFFRVQAVANRQATLGMVR